MRHAETHFDVTTGVDGVDPVTNRFLVNGESAFDPDARGLQGDPNGREVRRSKMEDSEGREVGRVLFPVAGEDPVTEAVLREAFDGYLQELEPQHRELLEAVYYHRLPWEAIAEARGVTHQAVGQQLVTAQRALVRAIAQDYAGFAEAESKAKEVRGRGRPPRNYEGEAEAASIRLRQKLHERGASVPVALP